MATRALLDASIDLDANGNGILSFPPFTSWAEVTISLQCTSSTSANFTVGIGNYAGPSNKLTTIAHKLDFGQGATMVSGPYILAPLQESLMVQINGGIAGDAINAALYGAQGIDPSNIDPKAVNRSTQTTQIIGNVGVSGTVNAFSDQVDIGGFVSNADGTAKVSNINTTNTPGLTNVQAIVVVFYGSSGIADNLVRVQVKGIGTQTIYLNTYWFPTSRQPFVFPVLTRDLTTNLEITVQGVNGFQPEILLVGLTQSVPEFMEYYQPPWITPNQAATVQNITGGPTALVAPTANVKVTLFRFTSLTWVPGAAGGAAPLYLYHGPDAAHLTGIGIVGAPNPGANGVSTIPDIDMGPTTYPPGDGIWATNSGSGGQSWDILPVYSLS